MKPEYKEQLERLAETLYEPFRNPQEQLELHIERTDVAQLGKTALNRWDSEGTYLERD